MKHLNKLLVSFALLAFCGSVHAQSDLLADNTVTAPANLSTLYKSNDKITISELMPNLTNETSMVNIKCTVPMNVQIKFFNMDGNMVKQESYTLDKGVNELNVNASNLSAGIYMVQFYSKEGSAVRRFVKSN